MTIDYSETSTGLLLICFIIIQFVFLNNLNNKYILEDESGAELNKQTKPLKRKFSESYLGPVNEWKKNHLKMRQINKKKIKEITIKLIKKTSAITIKVLI